MVSGKVRWYGKRNEGKLNVMAMCPNQGSATQIGEEETAEMSTRLEVLQGPRKRHESKSKSKTLTATARVSVRSDVIRPI